MWSIGFFLIIKSSKHPMQEKLPHNVIQYLEIGRLFLQLTGWGHMAPPEVSQYPFTPSPQVWQRGFQNGLAESSHMQVTVTKLAVRYSERLDVEHRSILWNQSFWNTPKVVEVMLPFGV